MAQNESYICLQDKSLAEVEVNKSRFIAVAFHVESLDDVKKYLGTLKKSNPGAKHIPYAYLIGADYSIAKNNDDGEPSGSAGLPIYEAIKKQGLTNVLVAVVRYFGGTELGKSKLTRTFGFIANQALKSAEKYKMVYCSVFEMKLSYNDYANLGKILSEKSLPVLEKEFDESMPRIKFAIPTSATDKLFEEIRARVREGNSMKKVGNGYYKFVVE